MITSFVNMECKMTLRGCTHGSPGMTGQGAHGQAPNERSSFNPYIISLEGLYLYEVHANRTGAVHAG